MSASRNLQNVSGWSPQPTWKVCLVIQLSALLFFCNAASSEQGHISSQTDSIEQLTSPTIANPAQPAAPATYPIYVINLKSQPHRRKMMHAFLQAAGLDSIFVTAVTSDSLLVSHLLNGQETKGARSEVAAWQSHFGVSLIAWQ